jgi:hypothetical protein
VLMKSYLAHMLILGFNGNKNSESVHQGKISDE